MALNSSEDIYLSTVRNFSVGDLAGKDEDIFTFNASSLGSDTSGSYGNQLLFDGSDYDLESRDIFGLDLAIGTLV